MDEVTALLSESGPDLQCTVQRKLGRCMLQLRQCVAQSHRGGNQCESVGAASFGSHFLDCRDLSRAEDAKALWLW